MDSKQKNVIKSDNEDFEVNCDNHVITEYEANLMVSFIEMAYLEIQGEGLSERLKDVIKLDMPIWETKVLDEFLNEDEKVRIYEYIDVIKSYLND